MPLFSLPGEGGIGDLGERAFRFIDQLHELGANYWQVLPLNLVDEGGCPYASPSAFGCEPLLIDTRALGLHYSEEFSHEIDYEKLREHKLALLKEHALKEIALENSDETLSVFLQANPWASDLAVFLTLSEVYGPHWNRWPSSLRSFEKANLEVMEKYSQEYQVHLYLQSVVHKQWAKLKSYAESKNINIIGDIPIFVSADSFDAWRWPDYFKIDQESGNPLVITGAPPDEFNEDGQLWGTLNYNWDHPQLSDWWLKRLDYSQELYHLTRIDHFVGLYHVWESAPDATNAKLGGYVPSRGRELLQKVAEHFQSYDELPFIAEDLGVLNDEIRQLRQDFDYPTMRVYQFSLEESSKPQTREEVNEHMPSNVPEHCFYYTGTHDNNTLRGWMDDILNEPQRRAQLEKRFFKRSAQGHREDNTWANNAMELIFEDVLKSPAKAVILPLQDIFFLAGETRINVPGTIENNWCWRLSEAQWDQHHWTFVRELLIRYHRGLHA